MPGAFEAVDDMPNRLDAGELTASIATEVSTEAALLGSHIALRNQRRLQTATLAALISWLTDAPRPCI